MASVPTTVPPLSLGLRRLDSSTRPLILSLLPVTTCPRRSDRRSCSWRISYGVRRSGLVRAMVQQSVQQGPSATYAREMERLSAKESLLLALKDAGGFEALVTGKTTDMQRIDVTERITSLERLNPTPRPTTSPFLEGRWKLGWFGSETVGLFAARFIFERLPNALVNLSKVDVWVKDGYTKFTVNMRILNSIETKFILSSKLTVEGPLRMKEEYVDCVLDPPIVIEQAVPEQLRSVLGQASGAVQQLPVSVRDTISNGITVRLNGTFQRLFMISYLDDEILIIRNTDGLPEVLTRWDASPSSGTELMPENER